MESRCLGFVEVMNLCPIRVPGRQVCGSRDDDEMGSRRLGDDESEDLVVTVEGRVKSAV